MEGTKFTWFPKLTDTVAKVPEDMRGALLWALVQWGTYGEELELEWPLDAIFESLREDIANSKTCRSNGGNGGRGKKKGVSNEAKPPFGECETPLCDTENPPLGVDGEDETPLCGEGKGGSDDGEPKPVHTSPVHTSPSGVKRFYPPTPEDADAYAEEYCRKKGLSPGGFSGERFTDFYASKGWMVGKAKMKDWRAAVRLWISKDCGKEERNEYSGF